MKDCVFCKIVAGEIPCYKIYEDDFVLAFLDIANDAYGHTLIVPKKHYDTMMTCDNSTLAKVIQAVKKVGNHYVDDCGFEGWNVLNNCGKCADQSVMHMHFHVIPRKKNDEIICSTKVVGLGKVEENGDKKAVEIFENENKADLAEVCEKLKIQAEDIQKIDDENAVVLYTDGACSGNPGAGGWASILSYKGKEKVLSGGEQNTTNNRMELMAVIKGLKNVPEGQSVHIYSDSAYVVNAFLQNWLVNWQNHGWRTSSGGEVLNKDLWQQLLGLTAKRNVTFNKVKGHSDNEYNNRCDALAREEISKILN